MPFWTGSGIVANVGAAGERAHPTGMGHRDLCYFRAFKGIQEGIAGAEKRTRTSTVLPPPGPEPGASTNFAISALQTVKF